MKIVSHTVRPKIPQALVPLEKLAHNLWLSWNFDVIMLFIRLDFDVWLKSNQNPVKMLSMVSHERFNEIAQDDSYLAALKAVENHFEAYKNAETWYKGGHGGIIAYFSMEYGIDTSLPVYSGGLGMLSGDHIKTSSDLGLPLVGVGLLYQQGYFKQYLNAEGFQQESYPENDWYNMPVRLCTGPEGKPILIQLEIGSEIVAVQIWRAEVGRSTILLLDTNIDANSAEHRLITAALYGGDQETRIKQEILLGIGGIMALQALGYKVAVTHMNEGHSAFLALQRALDLMHSHSITAWEAFQAIWQTNIFTTHTPVPAGNERFSIELMEKYFRVWAQKLGIPWEDFLGLGRVYPGNNSETFCLTVLALKLSAYSNGVSELHGFVSRKMWSDLWPNLPLIDIPIDHVTNGIHPRTWASHNLLELLDRYLGPRFSSEPESAEVWNKIDRVSDEELWRTHERRKERLVVFARDRTKKALQKIHASESRLAKAEDILSPYALTITFARRFATYKRGNLLLRKPERLLKLITNKQMPVQFIFAGKAHPHDLPGKELIKELVHFSRNEEVMSSFIFLEDYDMSMSRALTSGSDVWLNTPRRPQEASGTSGMKAGINGVLNCSVLDGWWAEAYDPEAGWAIGAGEEYLNEELQDNIECDALFDLLENEIIPLYYRRGRDGLPRDWIRKMKASMVLVGQRFSTFRMLKEYSSKFYFPALLNAQKLEDDNYASARNLADYLYRARKAWSIVEISQLSSNAKPVMEEGEAVTVTCKVKLSDLTPEEVIVELYYGNLNSQEAIVEPETARMDVVSKSASHYEYSATVVCRDAGKHGYAVRILPRHPALACPQVPGLVKWA